MCEVPMTDILQLPSLKPLLVIDEGDNYRIEAEGLVVPTCCTACRSERLHGHGTQIQSYRDMPQHGETVQIEVHRRRFRCQDCGKTLFDPIAGLDGKRLATRRLVSYIHTHAFKQTFAFLARQVAMDEKTIRQIFTDHVVDLESSIRFVTPRWLGIDELKIIGAYRAIITNIKRRTVFDLLESRSKADLLPYFRALRDKDGIEWVTMDMYHVYRQVVHATLPQARIIVDKFHIQRMANNLLETMRKRFRKTLSQRQRLKLKDERFLLLKRQRDLSPEAMQRMQAWFRQFPLLGEAHVLKEGYLSVWDHDTRPAAEAAYTTWLKKVPSELYADFHELTTAMSNWYEEIFNYFEHPITNAYTESVNNLAKGMNRMGRGYSFEVIRARMLYDAKSRKAGTVVAREIKPERDQVPCYDGLPEDVSGFMTYKSLSLPQRTVERVVEYGPHIPTLTRLLEEGYFE